jgi:rhodanese-related sulfurtransferase
VSDDTEEFITLKPQLIMFGLFEKKKSYATLNALQFAKQTAEEKQVVILDVRSAPEFREGHLAGAMNLNVMDTSFAERIQRLDKDKAYYVYCRSGGRSAQACSILAGNGFSRVYNLAGGVTGWSGPLVR